MNGNNMKYKVLVFTALALMAGRVAQAEQIGSVDTVFKMFGPDHKIVVEAFDDPDVKNVTCYVSRAKTGGIKGGLGLAEDTSDAAISCQQVGPVELSDKIKTAKRRATSYSRNGPRWCSKSYRWSVFMTRSVTPLIWLIPTKSWTAHRKTR